MHIALPGIAIAQEPTAFSSLAGMPASVQLSLLGEAEARFRVCKEGYGQYASELTVLQAETARIEEDAVRSKSMTAGEIKAYRDRAGLTTGRGQIMLKALNNPDPLGSCEAAAVELNLPKE